MSDLAARARRAERLGVLGGSFDPPHLGHLHVARAARASFRLDHVLFVPAARNPHKPGRLIAGGAERAAMLELLLADLPWTSVWRIELDRPGPSYTVDTIEALRAEVGEEVELFLLLGSDNLEGLATWHRAAALLAAARPVLVPRAGDRPGGVLARLPRALRERIAPGLVDVAPLDASATEIRDRLGRGDDPGPAFPAALRDYVAARGLYRGQEP
ncbi:MAG: nicotinate (nicotinamide) nucleotide adenylyltransferase [Planctomycetota bacterium]